MRIEPTKKSRFEKARPKQARLDETAFISPRHEQRSPSRSDLLARAFDLGVENFEIMTNHELIEAIKQQEAALTRSLQ